MKSSNFNLQVVLLLVFGVGVTFFLFSRDKVVVKNQEPAEEEVSKPQKEEVHSDTQLSNLHQQKVDSLKVSLKQADKTIEFKINKEIAQVYYQAFDFKTAATYLEKNATQMPNLENYSLLGDTYFQAYNLALSNNNIGEFEDKTRAAFKKVLAIDPNNLNARTKTAMTYVSSDSPMKAIAMLRQVLSDDPNYEPALMNMGSLSMQSQQFDKAENRFKQLLKVNPDNVSAQLGLAYSLIEQNKDLEKAKAVLLNLKGRNLGNVIEEEIDNTLKRLN